MYESHVYVKVLPPELAEGLYAAHCTSIERGCASTSVSEAGLAAVVKVMGVDAQPRPMLLRARTTTR